MPDYEQHTQPIVERHCIRCHGEQNPDGGLEFTSRRVDGYLQSYRTLFGLVADDPTPLSAPNWPSSIRRTARIQATWATS